MAGSKQRSVGDNKAANGKSKSMNGHGAPGKSVRRENGVSTSQAAMAGRQSFLQRVVLQTLLPIFLLMFCPNLTILLWFTAAHCDGSFLKLAQFLGEHGVIGGVINMWQNINVASALSVSVILGYMLFALLLQVTVPGPRVLGPVTPKGNQPVYRDNGFSCYVITMITFGVMTCVMKVYGLTPTVVFDHFDEFLATLTILSFVLCIFLHIKGLFFPSSTDSGSTGNPIFDFYWGTELYPRVLGVDVKVFTNCRFGMTIWPLLVLIFALKSYETYGFVDSMWASCFLQMLYFSKFFWWESGYMHTIDIMLDRAGYYICWGCLVYIPGVYASVSLYLVHHPVQLGIPLTAIIVLVGVASIVVNYLADLQKQQVRRTDGECLIWGRKPDVIRAKYELESGEWRESLLLVSGYWAVSRHFHYIPELLLAFSWSVPGLFHHVMPYVYFLWLCLLLTHRTFRDDTKCSKKYGKYWAQYCKRVPYKIIPGIF